MNSFRFSKSGLTVCSALLFCLAALCLKTPNVKPPQVFPPIQRAPREVTLSETEKVHGLFRVKGEGRPYTGWILESYPDGARKSRSEIVNGKPHGISEGFFADGQIQVREAFKNGVSEGARTRWHANGNKHSESHFHEGKFFGIFDQWHENGVLSHRVPMKDGFPHGISEAWYPSGYLKSRVELEEGNVIKRETWKDGEQAGDSKLAKKK